MVIAKGLPWNYPPQGILMKRVIGSPQRNPTIEAEINPDELEEMSKTVAAGLVTPAPGLTAQPKTPAMQLAAPEKPAIQTNAGQKRSAEGAQEEEPEAKKHDLETSPRRLAMKREGEQPSDETDDKKQKTREEGEEEGKKMTAGRQKML